MSSLSLVFLITSFASCFYSKTLPEPQSILNPATKLEISITGAARVHDSCLPEFFADEMIHWHWPNHHNKAKLKPIKCQTFLFPAATISGPGTEPQSNQKVIVTAGYPFPDSLPIHVKWSVGDFDVSDLQYEFTYEKLGLKMSVSEESFEQGSKGHVADGWVLKFKRDKKCV